MHQLSPSFLTKLNSGFLSPLLHLVQEDPDLDLHIRDNYINIYFKGNSLLKLSQIAPGRYRPELDRKFLDPARLDVWCSDADVEAFLQVVPDIKANILVYGKSSLEIEYEQLFIRANNYEPRNNSEYFIIDRQYVVPKIGRFDLVGIHWPPPRHRGQTVPLCLMEVKYALNADIQHVHEQLQRYYGSVAQDPVALAEEMETIFRQKLELKLFTGPKEAMKTLTISQDLSQFQFILILLDFNPRSRLLARAQLAELPFAAQVKIFPAGMAMWAEMLGIPGR